MLETWVLCDRVSDIILCPAVQHRGKCSFVVSINGVLALSLSLSLQASLALRCALFTVYVSSVYLSV